ncbi:hypothetical protein SBRCBS47491_007714 [Sporothrix bragantina]|uniref:3'-5' exonuclease domain-containing protein n=1 Tax=Sporothrix bragantina TaxID=671064 RepID=A0ABP0CFS8_9PEZI
MSQTPSKAGGSPYPATWSLWTPDNGIVFGGASASSVSSASSALALATPSATPRTVYTESATAPRQQPPWPKAVYPQLPLAAYSAPAVPFVAKRAVHAVAQKAPEVSVEETTEKTVVETVDDNESKEDEAIEKAGEKEELEEVLPPETTLDFKIPDDIFRAARDAAEGTPESYFSYAMYRRPPLDDKEKNKEKRSTPSHSVETTVKVHYCKTKHSTERVCKEYFTGEPLLGFDLEWMPNATKFQGARENVCLMQIASPSRIGLFHLSLFPKGKDGDQDSDLVGPVLRSILEDASTLKAGVAIKGDATRVQKYLGVQMRGVFELSHLHRLVVHSKAGETHLVNKKLVSLANQAKEHLRLPMFKGQDIRSGNWSKALDMDQIIYSASDAYAAVQIFSVLDKQRESLEPKPPLPACVEYNLPIKTGRAKRARAVAAPADTEEGDEADEVVDVEDDGAEPAKNMTQEYMAQATGTVEIEAEAGPDEDASAGPSTPAKSASATPKAKTPTPRSPRTPRTPKAPAGPKDARITAAENWLMRYRTMATASGRAVRARPASLRAYHLWHGDATLDPAALAALLRDPPLQTSTVMSYILEAVQLESLPYSKTRMRVELLEQLPADLRKRRYLYLSKACGYTS